MNVTVEVVGEGSHDLEVEDATYADLLAEVDLSPHEVSVMVDGRPVPEDQPVDADHVKILRLIKGGSGSTDHETKLAAFERQSSELGSLHDHVGRMPAVAVPDARDDPRRSVVHRGDTPADRPPVDDVLAMVDRLLADEE